jgi:hypothetical protein
MAEGSTSRSEEQWLKGEQRITTTTMLGQDQYIDGIGRPERCWFGNRDKGYNYSNAKKKLTTKKPEIRVTYLP